MRLAQFSKHPAGKAAKPANKGVILVSDLTARSVNALIVGPNQSLKANGPKQVAENRVIAANTDSENRAFKRTFFYPTGG